MDWTKYKVIQTIKQSNKAVVMFASVDGFEHPVIVKHLHEANPEVYRLISKLDNEHLPKIYHMEETPEELLIVEEYIDGITLDNFINQNNPDEVQLLELMVQLCEVLEVLHGNPSPVIHRDIKPSNLLITSNGVLKLIDFDASRFYKSEKNTSDTRLLGTIEYAAPEQFGYTQTDTRSDIYSLGVTLSGLAIGDNPKIKKSWKHLIGKCTSFDPENRYKNVQYVKKDIKKCIFNLKFPWLKYWWIPVMLLALTGGILLTKSYLDSREAKGTVPTGAPSPTEMLTTVPSPTDAPTLTPVPTETPTPAPTETPTPVPTETPTPTPKWMEQYASVEEYLSALEAVIYHYYQGIDEAKEVLWYQPGITEQEVGDVVLEQLLTGDTAILKKQDMYRVEDVLVLGTNCFESLETGYYKLVQGQSELCVLVHAVEENADSDDIIFVESSLYWDTKSLTSVSFVMRPDASGNISGVYACKTDANDPFSEVLIPLSEDMYTLFANRRGVQINLNFSSVYGINETGALYIEFDDGRGERVWTDFMENNQ